MPKYEILSVLLGHIATIVSLVVWGGQRRIRREANDLQRKTSELAKKQLENLLREEKGKNAARLSFDIFKDGKTYRFCITNISSCQKNIHPIQCRRLNRKMLSMAPFKIMCRALDAGLLMNLFICVQAVHTEDSYGK